MACSFSVEQQFNRRAIGYLWDKRAQLDPGQVSIINSIYNNKKKGSVAATQSITYKLSNTGAGKLGFGRLYGTKGSFETLEKECRGTICKDFYYDIDIVNCHPVLLTQFARSKGYDMPEVDKYVQNREAYLKNVMTESGINRDDAKQNIISVLYGGSVSQKSFLYELSEEVRKFSKALFIKDEYADLAKAVRTNKNIYGSFLSYILQTEERKCMLAMKTYFETQGWSVDVLCYDGVMIRKRDGPYDLKACEDTVETATGYKISLISKDFSSFELPTIGEEVAKGVTLDAYKQMKADFEQNHFYHLPTGKYVKVNDDSTVIFMELTHAHEVLNPVWKFKNSEKLGDYTPFLDLWRKDETRRVCSTLSFNETTNPDVFVLPIRWQYLKAPPLGNPRNLELFSELIDLATSGDEVLRDYVIKWLAHLLQKPCELPGIALILTGEKGVGKDTLGDFLQKFVVGFSLSTNYTTNAQFFGTHDMGKINKFLIKLEETSKKDCFEHASELKATITAQQITANPKGVKEVVADNFARYIFTTNKTNPVDLSNGERRFVLLKCSKKRKGDYGFWNDVRKTLFTPEGGRDVAEYLLSVDISEFQIQQLPANDYQESIIRSEETSEAKFVAQLEIGQEYTPIVLYDMYVKFCSLNSLPHATNSAWMCRNLQEHVRNGSLINRTNSSKRSYYSKGA
jgi:hypothetical protein